MSANVEAMVREGINAFKAGRKDEARALLSKVVELDPYHEEGWLWLSGVVDSTEDQRTCLENVLAINPASTRARSGLDYLRKQAGEDVQSPPAVPPPAPPPAPSAPSAPVAAVVEAFASSPTSVEWADEPVVEDWTPAPREPEAYEDWVSGLQLGPASAAGTNASSVSPMPAASPFYDTILSDSDEADAETLFANSPAFTPHADPPPNPPAVAPLSYRPPPPPASAAPVSTAFMPPAETRLIELDDDEIILDDSEEDGLFPNIPREIRSTRLPGTNQRGPILLKLSAAVLALLNLAAAFLIVWNLVGRA